MKIRKHPTSYMLYASLLVAILLALVNCSYGQDSIQYIPDGTEGEMLEVVKTDSVHKRWRDKRWRLFPGKYSTFKLGAALFYDYAAYRLDDNSKRQADSAGYDVESQFKMRDFRFLLSGQLKTKRTISWKAGIMYDGVTDEWFIRETGFMINTPELWGNFFIGRTKEGFSLNKVMNAAFGWGMERQTAIDVIPILADGIKWLGYLPKQRILWNLGIYTDWLSDSQGFSTYKWQTVARVGWLAIYSQADKTVLHVALNYRYGRPDDDDMRLRSRPESNPAPYYIDTNTISTNSSNHLGGEIYYSNGPWMFGSEFYVHKFYSPGAASMVFNGGEVTASYFITGETRPYSTASGIYGFTPVARPVFKGGPGAWEVVLRYSTFDLDDGPIRGGKFWKISPMVNWYLSKELRLEFAYGYGVLDRFNLKGATQFFQARIQVTLL
jgi:phosphate-selective porin OprO/OprP